MGPRAVLLVTFLLIAIIPAIGIERVHGSTQTIQQEIDAAADGDTILVAAGTYVGRLVVAKPVLLVGENRNTTIIDGGKGSPVILVTASNVKITGFTIRNAAGPYPYGILVTNAVGVNVTDNIISASIDGDAVALSNSNSSRIVDNIISGNLYGVNATGSYSNFIGENLMGSNVVGVQLWNSQFNVVANNTLVGGESGIDILQAYNNTVARNLIKRNYAGIDLELAQDNLITQNNLQLNTIGINVKTSRDNILFQNSLVLSSQFQANHPRVGENPLDNRWDNATLLANGIPGGNYWDDYQGQDTNGDGIGDTLTPHARVDGYPLMAPYIPIALVVQALGTPPSGQAPLTVSMTTKTLGGTTPYSFSWNFGDNQTGSSATVSHTYSVPGFYTVGLRVTDAVGSSDQDFIFVTVEETEAQPVPSSPFWLYLGGGALAAVGVALGVFVWLSRKRGSATPRPR